MDYVYPILIGIANSESIYAEWLSCISAGKCHMKINFFHTQRWLTVWLLTVKSAGRHLSEQQ